MNLERRDVVLPHDRFLWKHQLKEMAANPPSEKDIFRYNVGVTPDAPKRVTVHHLTLENARFFIHDVRQSLIYSDRKLIKDIEEDVFGFNKEQSLFDHEMDHIIRAKQLLGTLKDFKLNALFVDVFGELGLELGVVIPDAMDPVLHAAITLAPEKPSIPDFEIFGRLVTRNVDQFEQNPKLYSELLEEYAAKFGRPLGNPRETKSVFK